MTDQIPSDNQAQGTGSRPSARTDIRGYINHFEQRMSKMQEQAEESQTRLGEVKASASSDNGEVTVTVGAGGALTDIAFGTEMRRTSPESMAEMVKETYQRAVREASQQAKDVMSDLFGADSPAAASFNASMKQSGSGGDS